MEMESAEAMIIPLPVAALLLIGMGAGLGFNNYSRKEQFEQQYKESQQKFLESEKERGIIYQNKLNSIQIEEK